MRKWNFENLFSHERLWFTRGLRRRLTCIWMTKYFYFQNSSDRNINKFWFKIRIYIMLFGTCHVVPHNVFNISIMTGHVHFPHFLTFNNPVWDQHWRMVILLGRRSNSKKAYCCRGSYRVYDHHIYMKGPQVSLNQGLNIPCDGDLTAALGPTLMFCPYCSPPSGCGH